MSKGGRTIQDNKWNENKIYKYIILTIGPLFIITVSFVIYSNYESQNNSTNTAIKDTLGSLTNGKNDVSNNNEEKVFKEPFVVDYGDIAVYGGLDIKISGVESINSFTKFGGTHQPELGQFIIVDLDVKNTGDKVEDTYSGNFRLLGPDNADYEWDISATTYLSKKHHKTFDGSFNPGSLKHIRMVFDVPKGSVDDYKFQIQYTDGVGL